MPERRTGMPHAGDAVEGRAAEPPSVEKLSMLTCRACGDERDHPILEVREMLQGTRRPYRYMVCARCGSVQLAETLGDMTEYYANSTYGSFTVTRRSSLVHALRTARNRSAVLGDSLIGALVQRVNPVPSDYRAIGDFATRESRILDVGCGIGAYLQDLHDIGFRHVEGVDPFIERDITHPNGVTVRKLYLDDVAEHFDVIVSHHSFEHVPDPLGTLVQIREHLNPGGIGLVTVPVAEALFAEYGANCYLIQAPQHVLLPSIAGMRFLAEKAGLRLVETRRDASSTQAWMMTSELWKRDIPMNEAGPDHRVHFTKEQLSAIRAKAREVATRGLGDNVTFVLRTDP